MHAEDLPTELSNQVGRGSGRATGGKHIIHDQHGLTGLDRVLVNLQPVGSILELIVLAHRLPGQFAGFPDGHEAGAEAEGDSATRDEAASLDRRHDVWRAIDPVTADLLHHGLENLLVGQQRRDVLEDDPRLRKIGDVADQLSKSLVGDSWCHTTRRKYSRVRERPSSSATSGCQPSSVRAREMSGRRCLGSSTGSCRNSIALLESASRTMIWASSTIVTSCGLPRLTGRSSPFSSTASTPRTRSDT